MNSMDFESMINKAEFFDVASFDMISVKITINIYFWLQ